MPACSSQELFLTQDYFFSMDIYSLYIVLHFKGTDIFITLCHVLWPCPPISLWQSCQSDTVCYLRRESQREILSLHLAYRYDCEEYLDQWKAHPLWATPVPGQSILDLYERRQQAECSFTRYLIHLCSFLTVCDLTSPSPGWGPGAVSQAEPFSLKFLFQGILSQQQGMKIRHPLSSPLSSLLLLLVSICSKVTFLNRKYYIESDFQ